MKTGEPDRLTPAESAEVTDRVDRFRAARRLDPEVPLDPFVPTPGSALRPVVLRALIQADMELRMLDRFPVRVESYAGRFPTEFPSGRVPVALLVAEYRLRHRHADKPALDEYRNRFPEEFDALSDALVHPAEKLGLTESVGVRSAPPAPKPEELPDVGHGYRLFCFLGGGSYGKVYEAEAPGGVPVAVKVINRSPEDRAKKDELEALEAVKSLSHSFLLKTNAFWVDDEGRLVIVMELAQGSLEDRLKECLKEGQSGVPVEELVPIFIQAAEALDYLHHKRVTHRDVKPENILLLNGDAKVADLGLARSHRHEQTLIESPQGTMPFIAPEVFGGAISPFSDQYSLAATYVKVRLGRWLFPVDTAAQMLASHLTVTPSLDGLPEAEREVLLKALSKDPNRRYSHCTAFARALQRAVLGRETASSFEGTGVDIPRTSWKSAPKTPTEPEGSTERPSKAASALTLPDEPPPVPTKSNGSTGGRTAAARKKRPLPGTVGVVVAGFGFVVLALAVVSLVLLLTGSRHTATITIETTPPGARVVFRDTGEESSTPTPGPFTVEVKNEPRKVRLELAGHEPAELEIDPARDTHYAVVLKPIPRREPPPSAVTVETTPSGARLVWLDTNEEGRCPGPFLLKGPRTARIELAGYEPLTLEVDPAKATKHTLTLKPEPVSVRIVSRPEPGCAVTVDGVDRGLTPLSLKLLPGKYSVGVARPGRPAVVRDIIVKEPKDFPWDFDPELPNDPQLAADLRTCEELVRKARPLADFLSAQPPDKVTRWKAGAEAGDPAGRVLVGLCRREGIGLEKDEPAAVEQFTRADAAKHASGTFWLGRMCAAGRGGLPPDKARAAALYNKAFAGGCALAAGNLGELFLDGWPGQPPDPSSAALWFGKASDAGDVEGMYLLGVLTEQGLGVPKDDEKALELYRRAAKFDYPPAMHALGLMYWQGRGGLNASVREAERWFRAAAEKGYDKAMADLGRILVQDPERDRDRQSEGIRWYEKAITAGNTDAMTYLGLLYLKGLPKVLDADAEKAMELLNRAAKLGNVKAMFSLGVLAEGEDESKATQWQQRAAEKGYDKAMFRLAQRLEKAGQTEDAIRWYQKAAEKKYPGALERLKALRADPPRKDGSPPTP